MDVFYLLILCMAIFGMSIGSEFAVVVTKYGAVGDGKRDDSRAFTKAWSAACRAQSQVSYFIIPPKTFLLKPVKFSGPCKASRINVQLSGKLVASTDKTAFRKNYWLYFSRVKGLTISGKGTMDGKGSAWWRQVGTGGRPTALRFYDCLGLVLRGTTHLNSPRQHIAITKCDDAVISNLKVIAPQTSPNTDGIDIASSTNVKIQHSRISTGDDCIAINAGSSFIYITGMRCGPSHGISIGSLGRSRRRSESVEEIHVRDCEFYGRGIGVRIKTWQGGRGYVRNISYNNITVHGIDNPIVIDQFYCPHSTCKNHSKAIQVSNVSYNGIRGTSTGDEVISLRCSQSSACTNIVLKNINLRTLNPKKRAKANCINVRGESLAVNPVLNCLSHG